MRFIAGAPFAARSVARAATGYGAAAKIPQAAAIFRGAAADQSLPR
jgi:hypothetical protein